MTAWPEIPLGEILSERQEKPSFNKLLTGEIPIIAKIRFNDGQIELREDGNTKTNMILVRPGDLVLSGINAVKGAIAIYSKESDGPIAATIHYSSYVPRDDRVDVRYLWWLLRSEVFREALKRHVPGGIKTELKAKRFLPIPIPLPLLEEQRRIVHRIESLSVDIEQVICLRKETVGEIDILLNLARKNFIGDKPSGDWVTLDTFVAEIENGKSPNCEKRPADDDEWGVLKVGAASFGYFKEEENKALPSIIEPNPMYVVRSGDFLMIRANTLSLVGACTIVESTRPKLLLSDKTFRFVFRKDNMINHRFLDHVLKSPALRIQIEQQATGTSPTMKNISKVKVLGLLVPNLSLEEQQSISTQLDKLLAKVSSLRSLQHETQEELDQLMPSILVEAFKGEL